MNHGDVTSMVVKFYAYIPRLRGLKRVIRSHKAASSSLNDRLWLFALSLFLACFTLPYC